MKRFLKENAVFFGLFVPVFTALGIALWQVPQMPLHLWLNSYHTPCLDVLFRYWTLVPEYGIAAVAVLLLFWRVGDSLQLLAGEALSGLVVQTVKHWVRAPRPYVVFARADALDMLPLTDGVTMRMWNSFPSGHTSAFFLLFFTACLLLNRRLPYAERRKGLLYGVQALFFVLALAGAYSRIYLSQHFAADIFAGALVGVTAAALSDYLFRKLEVRYPRFCAWHIPCGRCR